VFRDELALIVVDVPDTQKNRKWMKSYKAKWKEQLAQLDIWMVSYPIDIERDLKAFPRHCSPPHSNQLQHDILRDVNYDMLV
jgi:hypothetical protein